ncbi:MAG: GIY-YIG nuclease family protein [Burkholderiales bacterium]|jgi:putative endonuclease
MWFVYMIRCADRSLYTGIAKDVARRLAEHNSGGMRAAHYTRGRRPVVLVYIEEAQSRSAAARREYAIKQLTRQAKDDLVRKNRHLIRRSIQSVAVRT